MHVNVKKNLIATSLDRECGVRNPGDCVFASGVPCRFEKQVKYVFDDSLDAENCQTAFAEFMSAGSFPRCGLGD